MSIPDKTVGQIRYFTYYLRFPDGEEWVRQVQFVHALQFELKNTTFGRDPKRARDILQKGETHWRDQNSVDHLIRVESVSRETRWGSGTMILNKRRKLRLS